MMTLMNARTGQAVASAVELAHTRAERRRGLLGRDHLGAAAALVLSPCCAVHTAFMRFAIDLVFVDRHGSVVRVVPRLGPWRMAVSARAHAVVELAGGTVQPGDVVVGDRLYLAPVVADGASICPARDQKSDTAVLLSRI